MLNIKEKLHNAYAWIKAKIVWLFIGSVALAAPLGMDIDKRVNPYEKIESRFEIQLPEQARIAISEHKPELYLGKWDDECFIKVGIATQSNNKVKRKLFTNKLEWKDGNNKVHMYPIENGYEYDITLLEKPASNIQTLNIETKGLKFYYQPPLTEEITEEEKAKGWTATETDIKDEKGNVVCHRPENVVGSYAVYHESKQGDYSQMGLKNYRAGKAFHWYRIKAWDKTGTEVWCELNIDVEKGIRTVEIPQDFLDNAVYPVVVDDTFGYTSVGESNGVVAQDTQISKTFGTTANLSEAGTLDKITATFTAQNGTQTVDLYVAIYREDSAGSGSHDRVVGLENLNATVNTTDTTIDFTANSEALTADDYILAALANGEDISGDDAIRLNFDSTGTRNMYEEMTNAAGSYNTRKNENPWTETAFSWSYYLSIYCTYTTGASAAITGTAEPTITETDVVTGGKTIIITLTNDTWVATVGADNAITTALIAGIDSAQSEGTGWDAVVKTNMVYTDVTRTSDTVVTITLGAEATYDITATETITVTIPATALTAAAQVVATPTFTVTHVVTNWLSGWDQRVKVTASNTNIDSDLTHFPLLLTLGTSVGTGNDDVSCIFDELTQDANRKKIAVTKTDKTTEIYVEIEKWDDANESAILWVSKSDLVLANGATTDLYLYYDADHADNSTYVADVGSRTEVWNSSFEGVWHLSEDPSGSAPQMIDSTSNNRDGTSGGLLTGDLVTGKIGDGTDFDGDDYIVAAATVPTSGDWTISTWINHDAVADNDHCTAFGQATASPNHLLYYSNTNYGTANGHTRLFLGAEVLVGSAIDDTTFRLATVRNDGGVFYVYLNATQDATGNTANTVGSDNFYIGNYEGGLATFGLKGILDEVRVASTDRGVAWIKAEYYSQSDGLVSWGSEETSAARRIIQAH